MLPHSWRVRPIVAILAATLAVVALACAGGDDPTATSAPTATSSAPTATSPAPTATAPSGPTATAPAGSTATSVPVATATSVPLTWIEQYMQSPGYRPEWGQPVTGGILKYGGSHATNNHNPNFGHGFSGPQYLPIYNALLRLDPWVGLGTIEPDLAESWEMSGDGKTLTFKLYEGVKVQSNPNLPSAVAALVNGDEFTCEDAVASLDFGINPLRPDVTDAWDPGVQLYYVDSMTCPDGPLGYTMVLNFNLALAKTMPVFAGGEGMSHNMDKDFIAYLNTDCKRCLDDTTPEKYVVATGTGAFIPTEYQADIISKLRRNPTYFREGLPLLDGIDHFVLKDFTTRFTALVTGQVHYFGEGSASMLPGQVEQVERDFLDRVTIDPALHSWGKGLEYNMARPPFDDVRVRTAFLIALDREEWAVFQEAGSFAGVRDAVWMAPGTFWAIPDDVLATWPGWRQPKDEDIAEANRLLDEVFGAGNRPDVTCSVSNSQMYIDGCLFAQDQYKRHLDVSVTLDIGEGAVLSEQYANGGYQFKYGSAQETSVGDPDDHFYEEIVYDNLSSSDSFSFTAVLNDPIYQNMQALIFTQSAELDPMKRRDMVWELERQQVEDLVQGIPYAWTTIFPAYTNDVRGWNQFDFGSQGKWTQWERTWLAE